MLPLLSRGCLGALIVLQTIQPARAWNRYVTDEPCCCEVEWDCCNGDVVVESGACGCEADPVAVDECGCGRETVESVTSEPAKQPEPVENNKAQAPEAETTQPALDAAEVLPPAPINVPPFPAVETESNEVFPGPAAETAVTADTEPAPATPTNPTPIDIVPPTTPAAEPTTPSGNAGGLFDEPAVESVPETPPATDPAVSTESPVAESEPAVSSPDDDISGETTQATESSTENTPVVEEETVEEEATETEAPEGENSEQPATDPLDDLFGPSSATDVPELNHEVVAPLRSAGGLASGEFRLWSNRDSDFQCQGRLIRMTTNGVFVAQPSGEFVAIAFSQLSDADLDFVRGQVQAQRVLLAEQTMQTQVASH